VANVQYGRNNKSGAECEKELTGKNTTNLKTHLSWFHVKEYETGHRIYIRHRIRIFKSVIYRARLNIDGVG